MDVHWFQQENSVSITVKLTKQGSGTFDVNWSDFDLDISTNFENIEKKRTKSKSKIKLPKHLKLKRRLLHQYEAEQASVNCLQPPEKKTVNIITYTFTFNSTF